MKIYNELKTKILWKTEFDNYIGYRDERTFNLMENTTWEEYISGYDKPNAKTGYLTQEKLFVCHVPKTEYQEEKGHYETIKEYPNGGRDVKWVIDVPKQEACEEHDEYEDILVYHPYTEEQLHEIELNKLRDRRETECFSIINRGELWYKNLTAVQKEELDIWYEAWLNVTETMTVPIKPSWLK